MARIRAASSDGYRPDALADAASAAATRPPAGPSGFSNFNSDTRRDGFERQLPPRPTEQARRELLRLLPPRSPRRAGLVAGAVGGPAAGRDAQRDATSADLP